MKSAKIHFKKNIERVKNLGIIYKSIKNETTSNLDLSDILRTQYVMLISALDYFIHEIVRIGMIESYNNKRKASKNFKSFIMNLDKKILFEKAIMDEKNDVWLNYQIRRLNGFKSFQHANKISDAMLLIMDNNIWEEISNDREEDSRFLNDSLNLIVDRRNQIAHEADIEPSYQELRSISSEDIEYSISFVESLVESIFKISELKN